MSYTKGKLFVMDLREFGEEQLSISNGQIERGIVCRIKNEVRKAPLDDEDFANAHRLVACWNACDGLSQDALDGGWTAAGISQYAKRLEQERDELLEALRLAHLAMEHMGYVLNSMDAVLDEDLVITTPAFEAVHALIDKYKGC